MHRVWRVAVCCSVLLCLQRGAVVCAQSNNFPTGSSSGDNRSGDLGVRRDIDPGRLAIDSNLSHRQFLARRQEMHKRMVDNAARLLAMTRELQEKTHLHEPGAEEARSLDDIAKLARSIRDQMRQ